MKIDSSLLKKFIVKASLNGILPSMILKINNEGIIAQQKDLSNTTLTQIKLNKKLDVNDEIILPIKNTNMLIKSVSSFSGDIELKKDKNILSLFNVDRQIDIVLSSEEFIECNLNEIPKSLIDKYDDGFKMKSDVFKQIVNDMNIVASTRIVLEIKDNKLEIMTGEDDFDTISMKKDITYKNVKAMFGEFLGNVIDIIDDEITICLDNNFPIKITENNDGLSCMYIVAPMVSDK